MLKLPQDLYRVDYQCEVGRISAEALADLLNQQATILKANEGGVTFLGGEPLLQAGFVAAVIDLLDNVHVVLDTSRLWPLARFSGPPMESRFGLL